MNLVCHSASMQSLVARARLLANSPANVLISGENGVGKKSLARLIHESGRPDDAPLICASCSSIDGHEPANHETSSRRMQHLIASAAGGTLLLDEVANLCENAQHALFEHLQDRELSRRGNEAQRLPPRCICTTRVSLNDLAHGILREDLFHRLYELHLPIPPLRDRIDDIPILADHFLSQLRQQQLMTAVMLETAAVARLQQHDWPGNVRELRNTLYRACFVSTRETIGVEAIEAALLPAAVEAPQQYDQLKLADVERRIILRRLDRFHGNKAKAAIDLGVTDRTLRNKMRQYRESGQLDAERRQTANPALTPDS